MQQKNTLKRLEHDFHHRSKTTTKNRLELIQIEIDPKIGVREIAYELVKQAYIREKNFNDLRFMSDLQKNSCSIPPSVAPVTMTEPNNETVSSSDNVVVLETLGITVYFLITYTEYKWLATTVVEYFKPLNQFLEEKIKL